MWKLVKIHAENLCSFVNLDWELPQNVTTLIYGNNLDNDSQRSNGSGKSTLIEAVAIGLTGDPQRQAKLDEIINDNAEQAIVALSMLNTDGGTTLDIRRTISRKNPQEIEVVYQGDKVVKSSVLEYNNYILDLIGVSKDDIWSSYVLSKRRYVSFLSSSDKDKKELINRFSNGLLVDQSIEALHADLDPLKQQQGEIEKRISFIEGNISALEEQIARRLADKERNAADKEEKMSEIRQQIAKCRETIRLANKTCNDIDLDWGDVEKLEKSFKKIEEADSTFASAYQRVKGIWDCSLLQKELPNYDVVVADINKELSQHNNTLEELNSSMKAVKDKITDVTGSFRAAQAQYSKHYNEGTVRLKELDDKMAALKKSVASIAQTMRDLNASQVKHSRLASTLKTALAGMITCPKCGHQWSMESGKSSEELQKSLDTVNAEIAEITKECSELDKRCVSENHKIDRITSDRVALNESLQAEYNAMTGKTKELDELNQNLRSALFMIGTCNDKIASLNRKASNLKEEMFTFIANTIDAAIRRFDAEIQKHENEIKVQEGMIESLEAALKQLETMSLEDTLAPLKESLKEYNEQLVQENKAKADVDSAVNALVIQEARFVEFKTYLANTKIAALSQITNEFLEHIGSDIRISFSGYTVLKSGKVRDKISISLLRDGIDCGAFGKFSAGERARAELATILALQKLININCEDGKGLDLLILDEILEAVDEDGLAAIFGALNNLGLTALVVSHGNVAENYPHKLIINKQNNISFINGKKT